MLLPVFTAPQETFNALNFVDMRILANLARNILQLNTSATTEFDDSIVIGTVIGSILFIMALVVAGAILFILWRKLGTKSSSNAQMPSLK